MELNVSIIELEGHIPAMQLPRQSTIHSSSRSSFNCIVSQFNHILFFQIIIQAYLLFQTRWLSAVALSGLFRMAEFDFCLELDFIFNYTNFYQLLLDSNSGLQVNENQKICQCCDWAEVKWRT